MGVPVKRAVTFVSSVLVNAAPGMSALVIVSHAGAALMTPVPVCRRNFRVVVMLPASLDSVVAALA